MSCFFKWCDKKHHRKLTPIFWWWDTANCHQVNSIQYKQYTYCVLQQCLTIFTISYAPVDKIVKLVVNILPCRAYLLGPFKWMGMSPVVCSIRVCRVRPASSLAIGANAPKDGDCWQLRSSIHPRIKTCSCEFDDTITKSITKLRSRVSYVDTLMTIHAVSEHRIPITEHRSGVGRWGSFFPVKPFQVSL